MNTAFLNIPLFQDLPREELIKLVQELPLDRTISPGAYLFREGDLGRKSVRGRNGFLEVLLAADTPDEMLLRVCGPGEYVGEMSLILPGGRADGNASAPASGAQRLDHEP